MQLIGVESQNSSSPEPSELPRPSPEPMSMWQHSSGHIASPDPLGAITSITAGASHWPSPPRLIMHCAVQNFWKSKSVKKFAKSSNIATMPANMLSIGSEPPEPPPDIMPPPDIHPLPDPIRLVFPDIIPPPEPEPCSNAAAHPIAHTDS